MNFFTEGIGGQVCGMMSRGIVVLVSVCFKKRRLSDNSTCIADYPSGWSVSSSDTTNNYMKVVIFIYVTILRKNSLIAALAKIDFFSRNGIY